MVVLLFAAVAGAEPTVVLISLDGTPPQALGDAELETLPALVRGGAVAERLVPVLPTNTFPNHVSLVTGVLPEVHGVVNNVFLDPERGLYRQEGDPGWIEVEPLWSLAARHGIVSASFHWVGSEGAWPGGRGPLHWRPFDSATSEREKVDQILAWLALEDPERRPRLVTSWFHGADAAGHRHGPGSRQARAALRAQDRQLGRLVAGLRAGDAFAETTLVVLSDHGMADVERRVDLQDALSKAGLDARLLGAGGFVTVSVSGDADAARRAVEVARRLGLEAHVRREAPPELGVSHPRFGDVVVLAPLGTSIERGGLLRRKMRGAHGYLPEEAAMAALFVAYGRGARPGTRLGRVRAVDVAPTLLALLDVEPPAWMAGRPIPALLPAVAAPGVGDGARAGGTR